YVLAIELLRVRSVVDLRTGVDKEMGEVGGGVVGSRSAFVPTLREGGGGGKECVRAFVRLSGCVWVGLQTGGDDGVRGGLGLVLRCSGGLRSGFDRSAMRGGVGCAGGRSVGGVWVGRGWGGRRGGWEGHAGALVWRDG